MSFFKLLAQKFSKKIFALQYRSRQSTQTHRKVIYAQDIGKKCSITADN